MKISFHDISDFETGTITCMLKDAYKPLLIDFPQLQEGWRDLEETAQEYPHSFFITTLNDVAIGFSSINPSNPNEIEMGHNIILPQFQNRGLGNQQLEEQLKRCREWNFKDVWATTGAIPFFLPARKMYLRNSFEVVGPGNCTLFETVKLRTKL